MNQDTHQETTTETTAAAARVEAQLRDALRGASVLITGASKGIGAAAARTFAECGARVVCAARSGDAVEALAQEIREAGGEAVAIATDVADYASAAGAVQRAVDAFGRLDVLINNAGVIEPIARIEDSDPAAWATAFSINAVGAYNAFRAAVGPMRAQGAGTIVGVSSGAATSALEGWSHYCASKSAALMLTRCGHLELAPHGLRVLGLSPGTVATDMQRSIKASGVNPVSRIDFSTHIPAEWAARALAVLATPLGDPWLGDDMKLRSDEARDAVGLPRAG